MRPNRLLPLALAGLSARPRMRRPRSSPATCVTPARTTACRRGRLRHPRGPPRSPRRAPPRSRRAQPVLATRGGEPGAMPRGTAAAAVAV